MSDQSTGLGLAVGLENKKETGPHHGAEAEREGGKVCAGVIVLYRKQARKEGRNMILRDMKGDELLGSPEPTHEPGDSGAVNGNANTQGPGRIAVFL